MRPAALCLLLALLASCSRAPSPDPDAQLKRVADAVAAFEDAVEGDAGDDDVLHLAEEVRQLAGVTPDETWTAEQRRRLVDLLKRVAGRR